MIAIKGGKKEQIVRNWVNKTYQNVEDLFNEKVLNSYSKFCETYSNDVLSYGLFNGVIKKIQKELQSNDNQFIEISDNSEIPSNVLTIKDLDFPNFKLYKSGKKIDELFSDFEEKGGLYGGTVNIVIGESGVGKTTVLLDFIASVKQKNPEVKVLYISSEMTRNDLFFYYKKSPIIGEIPILLLMDYIQNKKIINALSSFMSSNYDIILLDSYQDSVVKIKECTNWKQNQIEAWLTNLMIESAEKKGTAILAIQHMTKGGTYVGSTYLKHATTAMLEIRKDANGERYIEFSKNRRGGSLVNKKLFYRLDEKGLVVYDEKRYEEDKKINEIVQIEKNNPIDFNKKFEDLFIIKESE